MTILTCLCDPDIRCPELDCRGCECRAGTCAACAPPVLRRSVIPTTVEEAEQQAVPCVTCQRPTLARGPYLGLPEEARLRFRERRGHGLCDPCGRAGTKRRRPGR